MYYIIIIIAFVAFELLVFSRAKRLYFVVCPNDRSSHHRGGVLLGAGVFSIFISSEPRAWASCPCQTA